MTQGNLFSYPHYADGALESQSLCLPMKGNIVKLIHFIWLIHLLIRYTFVLLPGSGTILSSGEVGSKTKKTPLLLELTCWWGKDRHSTSN